MRYSFLLLAYSFNANGSGSLGWGLNNEHKRRRRRRRNNPPQCLFFQRRRRNWFSSRFVVVAYFSGCCRLNRERERREGNYRPTCIDAAIFPTPPPFSLSGKIPRRRTSTYYTYSSGREGLLGRETRRWGSNFGAQQKITHDALREEDEKGASSILAKKMTSSPGLGRSV